MEFFFLLVQRSGQLGETQLGGSHLGGHIVVLRRDFLDALLGELDVEVLILDFLRQRVVFAVVTDVILLVLVFLDQGFGLLDFDLIVGDVLLMFLALFLEVGDTRLETGDFVFHVLDFQRQVATIGTDFVNLRVDLLQGVKRHQLLLHAHLNRVFDDGSSHGFLLGLLHFFHHLNGGFLNLLRRFLDGLLRCFLDGSFCNRLFRHFLCGLLRSLLDLFHLGIFLSLGDFLILFLSHIIDF